MFGGPEPAAAANTMPAIAAPTAEVQNASLITRVVRIPDSRVASRAAPVAYRCRPNGVYSVTYQASRQIARKMNTPTGILSSCERPKFVNELGISLVIVVPLASASDMPTSTDDVPIVAMNGSTPRLLTSQLLVRPRPTAPIRTTRIASGTGKLPLVVWNSHVTATIESVIDPAIERSNTPAASGASSPTARIPRVALLPTI